MVDIIYNFISNVRMTDNKFIPDTPQKLISHIESHENSIINTDQLKSSLLRNGIFNVYTYLYNVHSDINFNYSLRKMGKSEYNILLTPKNTKLDLSPLNIDQLHDNFKKLPESDKILNEFNKYLRYLKWQKSSIDDNEEFPKGGIWKIIHIDYPKLHNDKEIFVNIN